MRKRSIRYRKAKLRAGILCLVAVIGVVAFFVDMNIRPLIISSVQDRAKMIATRLINNAVSQLIESEDISYKNIIRITYDDNNSVKAVECDVLKLNRFKADVGFAVSTAISDYDRASVSIRLGTLIGNEYLLGRGPKLNFKFDMLSTTTSSFSDSFVSAGINQTKHKIMLCIDTKISILIPWYNTSTQLKTEIIIAETVIVGDVPSSFTTVDLSKAINES
ncbi:MAG: sporulation protein YunB [Clostridia bacterium]|nr:sporulation protein YunB [Clostridia bacterium]